MQSKCLADSGWRKQASCVAALHRSVDFVGTHAIPPRLRLPLQAALRGEAGGWPERLTEEDVETLTAHGVTPLVFAATNHSSLRDAAIRAAAAEALRAHDIREVLAVLADASIDVLVTKGTALAYEIYPAPELRPRGDTDLLVDHAQVDRARAALVAAGFTERLGSGDEHGVRQTLFTRKDRHGAEHVYDVHWDVSNAVPFTTALRFVGLQRRAIDLNALGPHARGLTPVDALLLACIHRVAHHFDSERLIWLIDIVLLRDRMSVDEHHRFWRDAADAHVVGVCMRSIQLADAWMSRAPGNGPEGILTREEMDRDEPSRAFLRHDLSYGGVMLANLRGLPWRTRIERLWHLAFPSAEFMRHSGSVAPLAWLYVRRGLRGLRRLFLRASSMRP